MADLKGMRSGKFLIALISVFIASLVAEGVLRVVGFQPGFKGYSKFKRVDSLFVVEGFDTDSNGIMKISQKARAFICGEVQEKSSLTEIAKPSYPYSEKVYGLAADFMELRDTKYNSAFKTFYESTNTLSGELDSAIHQYALCPINKDGFKSIEFKQYDSKKKSILLLGDSFTWGYAASNITNCFADLLLAKGYVVYNSGIIGADPAQYLQIARVYIPRLKPDYVVVNFYMGNDIYYFERKPQPFTPIMYTTNTGYIFSHYDGIYFSSAGDAYAFTLCSSTIPAGECLFNNLCSKSVLTSLFWNTLEKGHLMNLNSTPCNEANKTVVKYYPQPYCNVELTAVKAITEEYNGKFILVTIPMLNENHLLLPSDVPGLFEGLEYFVPPVAAKQYRSGSNAHYNDDGHAVHASFIDSLLSVY